MKRALVLFLVVAACKGGGTKRPAPDAVPAPAQTFEAAMALICSAGEQASVTSAPMAERLQVATDWLGGRVTEEGARNFLQTLARAAVPSRAEMLRSTAKIKCALATALDPLAGVAMPEVGALALMPVPEGPLLVVAGGAITLEGTATPIANLAVAAKALAPKAPAPLVVALAPDTTFALARQIIEALRGAYGTIALLARSGDGIGVVPLDIADAPPKPAPAPMVAITDKGTAFLGPKPETVPFEGLHDRFEVLRKTTDTLVATAAPTTPASTFVPVIVVARDTFPGVELVEGK